MAFIEFARSIVGILFVMRTLLVFRGRNIAPVRVLDASGSISLISIGLIGFLQPATSAARFVWTLVVIIVPVLVAVACERRKLTALRARVPLFLDKWILNMRLGASVHAARAAALREEDSAVQSLLRPVFESGANSRRHHLILAPAALRELENVARAAHGALARLEMLRTQIRDEAEFRRKSGQAVRQSAIQSAVMLLMLVALTFFTIHRYGWSRTGDFVTIAIALSVTGTALMARLSRKGEWKL